MAKPLQIDTSFYWDWDEESKAYCVFGDNSGFAYSSWSTADQASQDCLKRIIEKQD